MSGLEYNWLLAPVRSARGFSVRLAHTSLLTVAVGAFCVACALLPAAASLHPTTAVAAKTSVALTEAAESGLPRVLLRLWILAPTLLPQR